MYRDISLTEFKRRFQKIELHVPFFTGFYTGATQEPKRDNIQLTKDLYTWLRSVNLLNTCTYKCHVLKGSVMVSRIYLKEYISLKDLTPYLEFEGGDV